MPFVLTLILFTLFLPQELSFYILGLRLTVTRLIFLLLTPVLVGIALFIFLVFLVMGLMAGEVLFGSRH